MWTRLVLKLGKINISVDYMTTVCSNNTTIVNCVKRDWNIMGDKYFQKCRL